jgi:hypothetical protein
MGCFGIVIGTSWVYDVYCHYLLWNYTKCRIGFGFIFCWTMFSTQIAYNCNWQPSLHFFFLLIGLNHFILVKETNNNSFGRSFINKFFISNLFASKNSSTLYPCHLARFSSLFKRWCNKILWIEYLLKELRGTLEKNEHVPSWDGSYFVPCPA